MLEQIDRVASSVGCDERQALLLLAASEKHLGDGNPGIVDLAIRLGHRVMGNSNN